jgi:hypothetical protein
MKGTLVETARANETNSMMRARFSSTFPTSLNSSLSTTGALGFKKKKKKKIEENSSLLLTVLWMYGISIKLKSLKKHPKGLQ